MKIRSNRITRVIFKIITTLLLIVLVLMTGRWAILSIFGSRPVCFWCLSSHVVHDYYIATGISRKTLGCSPEKITDIYGEPERIDKELRDDGRLRRIYIYDGFGIEFSSKDPERPEEVIAFRLYSPDIKICRDVHVGATRQQIIHAYRKCADMKEVYARVNDSELGDSVHDTGTLNDWTNGLEFTYDENDIVTSITYYPGDRYRY